MRFKLIICVNRRLTAPLGWWQDGEILGGRDEQAGGTWLASSRDGKLAFLTNVREIKSFPQVKSRGDLPVRFLKVFHFTAVSFYLVIWERCCRVWVN